MDKNQQSAFGFYGSWKEYAPIAFSNLLLIIVTLGIYRFWATTRTRRYLWSRTRFIDDQLEYTGTGGELFRGFLVALPLLAMPAFLLQYVIQALILRDKPFMIITAAVLTFLLLFYLGGVARFRALRYRLGRTRWHGIRGGSHDRGFRYGLSYMEQFAIGFISVGLLIPRAMMGLWNERWNAMSFGQHRFRSQGDWKDIFRKFLLLYLAPAVGWALTVIATSRWQEIIMMGAVKGDWRLTTFQLTAIAAGAAFVIGLIVTIIAFRARFLRVGIGGLSLSTLEFHFTATAKDNLRYIFVNVALIVATLGVGIIFMPYRRWKFFVTHLEAYGEIDLDGLRQSRTILSRHGEGLLDTLEMGAF